MRNRNSSHSRIFARSRPAVRAGSCHGHMRIYFLLMSCIIGLLFPLVTTPTATADPTDKTYKEYEVKVAYIYNFLKFVEWPQEKKTSNDKRLVIGVVGEKAFKTVHKILQGETAQGFKIQVEAFGKEDLKDIRKVTHCDALFFTASERYDFEEAAKQLERYRILTVGENEGFLEDGGMINIFIKNKKVSFEINKVALERSGLKLRSKMLRLAKRIIVDDDQDA